MRAPFWSALPLSKMPFLANLYQEWIHKKPLKGLSILHNVPLLIDTLCKVDCLIQAGAHVTLTQPKFLRPQVKHKILAHLPELSCPFYPDHQDIPLTSFDFILDCSAELSYFTARKGYVELTQTGASLYKTLGSQVPIVSVDDAKIKMLETFLGTGNGALRALKTFSPRPLETLRVIIFGYGKVGSGVAHALHPYTASLGVIENHPVRLHQAQRDGFLAISFADHAAVIGALEKANCVLTATGVAHVIGHHFSPSLLKDKVLANLGAEDEFGPAFPEESVLGKKVALNFLLEEPTLPPYIDPTLCAHNLAVQLILERNLPPGFLPFPADVDEALLQAWQSYHNTVLPPALHHIMERAQLETHA